MISSSSSSIDTITLAVVVVGTAAPATNADEAGTTPLKDDAEEDDEARWLARFPPDPRGGIFLFFLGNDVM